MEEEEEDEEREKKEEKEKEKKGTKKKKKEKQKTAKAIYLRIKYCEWMMKIVDIQCTKLLLINGKKSYWLTAKIIENKAGYTPTKVAL